MKRVVVDASSILRFFFTRAPDHPLDDMIASENVEMFAPSLIHAEVGNGIWRYVRAGAITSSEAITVFERFRRIRLTLVREDELRDQPLALAIKTGLTVYDGMYLALAIKMKSALVTEDARLRKTAGGLGIEV